MTKRFQLLTIEEVLDLPDPEWIVEGIFPATSLAEVYGDPGIGKSFLALSLGLSVASGVPWLWKHEVGQGPVVYFAAEGHIGMKARISSWLQYHGIDPEDVGYFRLVGEPLPLGNVKDVNALIGQLKEAFDGRPIALIVLDTLARCTEGLDENFAKEMGLAVKAADKIKRETGATVLLVHHTGSRKKHARGSTAVRAALDTQAKLDNTANLLGLCCEKQKDSEPFKVIHAALLKVGGSLVVVGDGKHSPARRELDLQSLTPNQQADEAAAKLGKREALKPAELTLQELFDIYGREKTPSKGKSKRDHDRRASEMFLEFFGAGRMASTLSERDWQRFVQERRGGNVGPSGRPVRDRQIEYDLKFLLSVLNWATKAGNGKGGFLRGENPLKGCALPKETSPSRPLIYEEEYESMKQVARDIGWRFWAALIVAHETGHRIGAIRQLRWSEVDPRRGIIRWRKSNDKIGREHETSLTAAALDALKEVRNQNPGVGEAWIFPSPENDSKPCSRSYMKEMWKRAEKTAGLDPVPRRGWHSLRRKFATELKGMPLKDLSDLGGWASPQTLLTCYQQPDQVTQREALKARRPIRRDQFGL